MAAVYNQKETAEKILRGDIPDGHLNTQDGLVVIKDEVIQIYMNLLSELLFATVDESCSDEMIANRVELFDRVMAAISFYRIGRLHKIIEALNEVLGVFQQDSSRLLLWNSSKMKNNVFSFIIDYWTWTVEERGSLMVFSVIDNMETQTEKPATAATTKPKKPAKPRTTTKKTTK